LVLPRVVFLLGRQLAVHQQVGDFEVVGTLGQLLDRIAAVLEDALVAVDVGDGGPARRGVDEPRVIDRDSGLAVALADLRQIGGPDRAVGDREVVLNTGAVVAYGQRGGRHV